MVVYPGIVTVDPGAPTAKITVAAPVGDDASSTLNPPSVLGTGSHRFSPLVSWLVATARPALTVELGPGDRDSLLSTCGAVLRADAAGAVRRRAVSRPDPTGERTSRAS